MKAAMITFILFGLVNCAAATVGATAASVSAAAYSSYDAYARATQPPEKIFPVPRRGRVSNLVYADDPRIPVWCSDAKTRKRIETHCAEREESERAEVLKAAKNAEANDKASAAGAEEERLRADVRKEAKKQGYGVEFDTGLGMTIVQIRSGEKKMADLKKTAIALYGDGGFVVMQVVNQNNVLFKDRATDAIVWLKDYAKSGGEITWLEGAQLTAMEWGYVAIRGTKEYKTLIGSKQAVVIEAVF